ncbi:A1pp-domain-containing protein [Schizophyllum commune H4-8]|uniref:Macro domain-containing protein n=1 Tax=Schizophyllum commune (strain H4-8 / FGSC 9210) TaxID=578458 RepID=D8Q5J3_SCHCM|nr:A1pp-domain-containing protein [Schizophyllum commune H4-8]KAI5892160.1 A1pp-domain-containing protein [Schizophyllum commune H4-8]
MVVRLKDIATIGKLYVEKVLVASDKPRYPHKASLLEKISLFQGDITKLEVDVIVNAANRSLLGGGGGKSQACHLMDGLKRFATSRTLGGAETGESKITKGYKLPAKHVIHTVGPIYHSGDEEKNERLLRSCYRSSLQLAVQNNLKHIAFCSVSTGIYGYPIMDATHVALDEVRKFYDSEDGEKLDRAIFVVWSDKDKRVYE